MKRTNIVLDERLVERAKRASGLPTTRQVVDFALRELVRSRDIRKVRALRGSDAWKGDLDALRRSRV
jgi:Arc/MetJ family transcription regulator